MRPNEDTTQPKKARTGFLLEGQNWDVLQNILSGLSTGAPGDPLGNVLGDGVPGASHWPRLWAPVLWVWRGCPGPFLKSHMCFDETGTRAKEERLCVMESSRFGPGPEVMFVFASCHSEEGHFGGRKVFRPQEPPCHIRGGHRGTEGLCLGSKIRGPEQQEKEGGPPVLPSLPSRCSGGILPPFL